MKISRLIICILCILNFGTIAIFAKDSTDLKFSAVGGGKFIYCNNPERIKRNNLSDTSIMYPSYIMNNENLDSGKYEVYASHLNYTELRDRSGTIVEPGFNIELDIEFKAKEDTKILLTAVGFETPTQGLYYKDGNWSTYQSSWECLNAVADFLQKPIYQINSDKKYIPNNFEPVEIELKAGESTWLSKYINNYSVVSWLRSVHILTGFEILSGKVDVNIAALKSNSNLGDRSNHSSSARYGVYYRDRQYKGISDTLPEFNSTELNYTIDDNTADGTLLPVTVYNQYKPEGNTVTKWYTHINPQEDIWARQASVESDMVSLSYYDESKLQYYGEYIDDEKKSPIWTFDTYHSDTKTFNGQNEPEYYTPNYKLDTSQENSTIGCNLGNYEVRTNYKLNVTNNGQNTRYFKFNLNTSSNNVVAVKDENGNFIEPYYICKGSSYPRKTDTVACVELPPNQNTKFTIEVILPINYPGGMENSFEISDKPSDFELLEDKKVKRLLPKNHTGKEYFKWVNKDIYTSTDLENWTKHELNDKTKKTFEENWENYEIKKAGDGYIARFSAYDIGPSFYWPGMPFFNNIYILDKDFNLVKKSSFEKYPTQAAYAKGIYFVKADQNYYSTDGENWEILYSPYRFPIDNGGQYCIATDGKDFYRSEDAIEYSKIEFDGDTPLYIDNIGDIYYYIEDNTIYTSKDTLNWNAINFSEDIETIDFINNQLIINKNNNLY